MKRFDCPKIQKKVCPYELDEGTLVAEYCSRCNIPEIYAGIRPKVPESHCEAGTKPVTKNREYDINEIYEYLMLNSLVFAKLSMDQRGELLKEMKNALDIQAKV